MKFVLIVFLEHKFRLHLLSHHFAAFYMLTKVAYLSTRKFTLPCLYTKVWSSVLAATFCRLSANAATKDDIFIVYGHIWLRVKKFVKATCRARSTFFTSTQEFFARPNLTPGGMAFLLVPPFIYFSVHISLQKYTENAGDTSLVLQFLIYQLFCKDVY